MSEVSLIDLESDTWYWYSVYIEGDLFHPIYINSEGTPMIDGSGVLRQHLKGLTFHKAIMPLDGEF